MNHHFSTYSLPSVKIRTRSVTRKRRQANRLLSLMLLTAFSLGCNLALSPESRFEPILPVWEWLQAREETETSDIDVVMAEADILPADEQITEAEELQLIEPLELVAAVPEISYPLVQTLVVESGDNFISLLGKSGVGAKEAHNVLDAMRPKYNPRAMRAGDSMTVTLDRDEETQDIVVTELSTAISPLSTLVITRGDNGALKLAQIDKAVTTHLARAGGRISSSLYETIVGGGMPVALVAEIIKAYSYDVDFQRDIRAGDEIDVVFERKQTDDGDVAGYGRVLYASLSTGNKDLRIYRYTDSQGFSDYYNAKGESVRKGLLRTPINGARISSGFGNRRHPILGYNKMHKGVDFAAPTGTPVYAAGDGVVNFVGRKGGYGNYVQIKHNNQYASAYAHLSRFASGIKNGQRVKQGQIIAYVGSTGASTGPHLHYEIHANGRQVNPANVKFKTGNVLGGKELAAFKRNVGTLQAQLDAMPKNDGKLAMLDMQWKM